MSAHHRSFRTLRRGGAAVVGVALLALSLSACLGLGDDGGAPKPVASIANLKGTNTGVKLDKKFVADLTKLKLTAGVTGGAKLTPGGSVVFPITGGNVTVFKPGEVSPYVIGQIQHEGSGLTLTGGGTTVRLSNLNVDPGASRVYGDVAVNGKTVASSAFVFQLDGRTLKPLRTPGHTAVLTGTKVEISPVAATLLDQTFKTKAVTPGLLVGIATITVKTT